MDSVNEEYKELIETALTHPSYAAENGLNYEQTYERLEFLGDAVVKVIASDYLYKRFPNYKEGELSNLRSFIVSDENLAKISRSLGLHEKVRVAKNDKSLTNNLSIAACALEALMGAFFLAGKRKELGMFFETYFGPLIEDLDNNILIYNPKAILQEYTQKVTKELPIYELVCEKGAAHKKSFEIKVIYKGETLATGEGTTKKAAQQEAALKACRKLGLLDKDYK